MSGPIIIAAISGFAAGAFVVIAVGAFFAAADADRDDQRDLEDFLSGGPVLTEDRDRSKRLHVVS